MRDEIIFPYQKDMIHETHVCRSGNAVLVIFHLEWKHLPLHSTYGGSPYSGKFELCSLYRIDSRKGREKWQEVASGYTSDKWWIGNKWGILTGNIRDIKKEPHVSLSYIERLKSDTLILSELNKGHVRRGYGIFAWYPCSSARARLAKKKHKPEFTYVRDISRKSNKRNLIELHKKKNRCDTSPITFFISIRVSCSINYLFPFRFIIAYRNRLIS